MPSLSTTGSPVSKTLFSAWCLCFRRSKIGNRRTIKSYREETSAHPVSEVLTSCNCTIQFSSVSRNGRCNCVQYWTSFTCPAPVRDEPCFRFRSLATTLSTDNPFLPASAFARRSSTLPHGETLRALEKRTEAHPVPEWWKAWQHNDEWDERRVNKSDQ